MRSQKNISEYNKEYRLNHKEYFMMKNKEYSIVNKESISERKRMYYLKNRQKLLERKRAYYSENKEKINKQTILYVKNKKNIDCLYRLKSNIRGLITSSIRLRGYRKKSKTCEILGCTFEEFKIYLESKFEPWMNWNNYGNWNGQSKEPNISWDIDHIIPMCLADSEEKTIKLNHYMNLQPLCSYVNRYLKSNKSTQ